MRLRKLRLSGFKSFVEPATFDVPDRAVAVVGPNGCGKSNLIDAVRWVMGESAARQLRGESMEDVIFNGSANRQPVGQATIELVFDNSAGRLGGPWARYSEIAVKRVVSRGGQSTYFLNGSRCRRRDITDIFLGTGLGPRSYAIIEQGLISRIIESRPEDLRLFLEEAAGISRYKERRRETETRIRHTRDNLARLSDLRDELERQLRHLQRQARNAEKYREYRATERLCKARLLALQWQTLDQDLQQQTVRISEDQTALEAVLAEQRHCEARLVEVRERRTLAGEHLDQMQQRHYQLAGEISRAEQTLEHQRQLRQQQQSEHDRVGAQLAERERQRGTDRDELENVERALAAAVITEQDRAEASDSVSVQLARAEQELHQAQQYWEQFNQQAAGPQRQADVERARIEHLERQQRQSGQRRERLLAEQESLAAGSEAEIATLQAAVAEAARRLGDAEAELARVRGRRAELDRERTVALETQRAAQHHQQSDQGRLTSLQTLQEAALGTSGGELTRWLAARGLQQATQLAEHVDVEPGWESALETVLEDWLDARCIGFERFDATTLSERPPGPLRLLQESAAPAAGVPGDTLAARVSGATALQPLLASIIVADGLVEALERCQTLEPEQSVVTRDAIWLGRHWLRVRGSGDGDDGVLLREREIRSLEHRLTADVHGVQACDRRLQELDSALSEADAAAQRYQEQVNQNYREHARLQERLTALVRQQHLHEERRQHLQDELQELELQIGEVVAELGSARQRLETALAENERFAGERRQLTEQRERLQSALQAVRHQADQARSEQQRHALELQQLRSREQALQLGLARLQEQSRELRERHQALAASLAEDPEPPLRAALDRLLEQRLASDSTVAEARQAVAEQDAAAKALEQQRGQAEKQAYSLRERLERRRLTPVRLASSVSICWTSWRNWKPRRRAYWPNCRRRLTNRISPTSCSALANVSSGSVQSIWPRSRSTSRVPNARRTWTARTPICARRSAPWKPRWRELTGKPGPVSRTPSTTSMVI